MRRITILFLTIAFVLIGACSLSVCAAAEQSGQEEPAVVILYTGEYSGSFESSDSVIGMDIVAALFQEQTMRVPATFLLDCGDTIQGAFFSNNNEGEAAIEIMNAVRYDVMTLGNHEFDYGYNRLLELARSADFPFLTQPSVFNENEPLAHTAIIERNGYKIGVFGLTTPASKQISNAFDTDFGNPATLIESAKKSAKSLRESGADIVVCLSHIGNSDNFSHDYGSAMDIAENVLGIDIIIDGHSDSSIDHSGTNTPVVMTEGGSSVGIIEFYDSGSGFTIHSKMLYKDDVSDIKPDSATAEVVNKWKDKTEAAGREIIGTSSTTLADYEKGVIREQETAIGNVVADSIKHAAGSDIAFIHSGNIRAPLNAGEVTWIDVNNILPYSNYILAADVSGSVIRAALEHSAALRGTQNAGGFLQVAGLTYTINPDLPEYARVTSIMVGDEQLADDKIYSLAVLNFIAEGGDGYSMLIDEFADSVSKGDMATVFADYLKANGENITNTLEGRIMIQSSEEKETKDSTNMPVIIGAIALLLVLVLAAVILVRKSGRKIK